MTKRLRDEDRRAVDMLLDRLPNTPLHGGSNGGNGKAAPVGFASTMGNGFQHRLETIERLLGQLNHLPASDPSPDLLSRTLERIKRARPAPAAIHPSAIAGQRPGA